MKNKSNDGILCDYCGEEFRIDFIYYSFDFKNVNINEHGFSNHGNEIILSVDLCERCIELFRQRLIDISSKVPASSNRCDISGAVFPNRNYQFIICNVSKVSVNLSDQPYTCDECRKARQPSEGPCSCGSTKLFREAKLTVDNEHLELNFTPDTFKKFTDHVNYIHGIGDPTWTK